MRWMVVVIVGVCGFAVAGARADLKAVGWRNDGSGRYPDADPPTTWSATKNVKWSTAVGRGYSSPVVAGGRVFVLAEPGSLFCLDTESGKVVWKVATSADDLTDAEARAGAANYKLVKDGSGLAAATPLVVGDTVYLALANGIVRAIGAADGKGKWAAYVDAPQSTGYGRASSPIVAGGRLIVHMTNLYAFDLKSGKRLWVNDGAKGTYGTPAAFSAGGVELIATSGGDVCRADDGTTVASELGVSVNSSPVAVSGEGGGGIIYAVADGALQATRFDAAKMKDALLWSGDVGGEVFGSPLVAGDVAYVVTAGCELCAFDAAPAARKRPAKALIEGRELFPTEGDAAAPTAYASLTLAGRYLFASDTRGETVVMEATREAKVVARNKIGPGSGATPAFAGRRMYLRDGEKIYCVGE